MKRLNVHDIHPGLTLAEDVRGANGQLVLFRDVILEEKHIRVLNMWGVTEVLVQETSGQATDEPQQIDNPSRAAAEERVNRRFFVSDPTEDPIPELREQCVANFEKRFARGWTPTPQPKPHAGKLTSAPSGLGLDRLTSDDSGLVSLPDIYFRVSQALDDPACTAARLADLISKDSSMSARLLKLVNSPAMGQGQKVDSLSRGVVLVGVKELSQLALGISVMSSFKGLALEQFPVVEFWKHSLACGVLARLLAMRLGLPEVERFFVSGMLHDLGRLVMIKLAPRDVDAVIALTRQRKAPLWSMEREFFGFDHCQVAAALMERWRIPASLAEIIATHHAPTLSGDPVGAAIVNTADALAIALEYGFSGQHHFTGLAPGAWKLLGQPPSVVPVVIAQANRQLDDIYAIFLG